VFICFSTYVKTSKLQQGELSIVVIDIPQKTMTKSLALVVILLCSIVIAVQATVTITKKFHGKMSLDGYNTFHRLELGRIWPAPKSANYKVTASCHLSKEGTCTLQINKYSGWNSKTLAETEVNSTAGSINHDFIVGDGDLLTSTISAYRPGEDDTFEATVSISMDVSSRYYRTVVWFGSIAGVVIHSLILAVIFMSLCVGCICSLRKVKSKYQRLE